MGGQRVTTITATEASEPIRPGAANNAKSAVALSQAQNSAKEAGGVLVAS